MVGHIRYNRSKALKMIDAMLFKRNEIKRAIAECRSRNRGGFDDCAGRAHLRDNTAMIAMSECSPLSKVKLEDDMILLQPEKWLQAIYLLEQVLGKFEQEVLRMFYFKRYSVAEIEKQRVCSRNVAYYTLSEIRSTFLDIAIQCGLVKTFKVK